jgi:hypothetical protein
VSAQPAEKADPRCRHHVELDSAIRALRSAAWTVEDAASDIPDVDEWLGTVKNQTDRQLLADRLASVAGMVHDGHDAFPWQWCQRPVCVELRDLRDDLLSEAKPKVPS